jgi:hypothetical protein
VDRGAEKCEEEVEVVTALRSWGVVRARRAMVLLLVLIVTSATTSLALAELWRSSKEGREENKGRKEGGFLRKRRKEQKRENSLFRKGKCESVDFSCISSCVHMTLTHTGVGGGHAFHSQSARTLIQTGFGMLG